VVGGVKGRSWRRNPTLAQALGGGWDPTGTEAVGSMDSSAAPVAADSGGWLCSVVCCALYWMECRWVASW